MLFKLNQSKFIAFQIQKIHFVKFKIQIQSIINYYW